MEREYTCERCGKIFTKDTVVRAYALKYCPECRRIQKNEAGAAWRQRQRDKAFAQMRLKRLNNNKS